MQYSYTKHIKRGNYTSALAKFLQCMSAQNYENRLTNLTYVKLTSKDQVGLFGTQYSLPSATGGSRICQRGADHGEGLGSEPPAGSRGRAP